MSRRQYSFSPLDPRLPWLLIAGRPWPGWALPDAEVLISLCLLHLPARTLSGKAQRLGEKTSMFVRKSPRLQKAVNRG
jgi:hypothetical protein